MTSLVIETPIVDKAITVICQFSYIIWSDKLIAFFKVFHDDEGVPIEVSAVVWLTVLRHI